MNIQQLFFKTVAMLGGAESEREYKIGKTNEAAHEELWPTVSTKAPYASIKATAFADKHY